MNKLIKNTAIAATMFTLLTTTAYTVPASAAVRNSIQRQSVYQDDNQNYISLFVYKLYKNCLQREPDVNGFNGWVSGLSSGNVAGKSIVRYFINSPEFRSKTLTDSEYVERLYNTCLDRKGEPAGTASWLYNLKHGYSRSKVLEGFLDSPEYANRCAKYKIPLGK